MGTVIGMNLGFRHNFECFREDEYKEFYKLVNPILDVLSSMFQYTFYVFLNRIVSCVSIFHMLQCLLPPPLFANKLILRLKTLVKIFERIFFFRYTQYLAGKIIVSVLNT